MGRFRIDDDIVRHLSTLQRLGENVEVQVPGELVPVGARTVFRAVRTRAAAQIGGDWVWPFWLERQLDPTSPSFVPRGHLPVLTNVTHRNWTAVGNVASARRAIVDERGLVTPWFDGWSLDWWVGAEDRWHFPSRDTAVRQRLVADAPVIETALRIPGGDALERVYAVAAGGSGELLVIEVENRSPVPIVLALAVRPYNPEGLAVVERIALHDGRVVTVDGRPALLLPKPPSSSVGSTFNGGDVASLVAGQFDPQRLSAVRCDVGMAQAALLFPLIHSATLRVAIPLERERRSRLRGVARRRVARLPQFPSALPAAGVVARGWALQARRDMTLTLPGGRLADAVEANRRFLLLFHGGGEVTPGPYTYHRFWFRDAAYLLGALDRYGFHDEVGEVLRTFPRRQRLDGFFFSQRQEWDANGCALHAIAEHWRLCRDDALLTALLPSIKLGARWIDRQRRASRRHRRRRDPALRGLLRAGTSAEHLGPFDYFYWDNFWSVAGLRDAAELLSASGAASAAARCREWADELCDDISASLAITAERLATAAIPAGPGRRIDAAIIGSLVACEPLRLLAPDAPEITATVDLIRQRFCLGQAFFQPISHTGLGTYLTLQLAAVELARGERQCLDRLAWLLDAASPTWTWPEAIHPSLGGGCMGDGHHGWAAAEFVTFVRNLLVREVAVTDADPGESPVGLSLCSMVPDQWVGQPLEVTNVPTHVGRVSFGLRWHGARPALLWELQPHQGVGLVRLTAPGLDPSWTSRERRGEALLGVSPLLASAPRPGGEEDVAGDLERASRGGAS
jgi:hypothetical protein